MKQYELNSASQGAISRIRDARPTSHHPCAQSKRVRLTRPAGIPRGVYKGLAIALALLAGCAGPTTSFAWMPLADEPCVSHSGPGFTCRQVLHASDVVSGMVMGHPSPLFLQKDGVILDNAGRPWLDLTDHVEVCHQEQGLLGAAYDGDLYVTYTASKEGPCSGTDSAGRDMIIAHVDPKSAEVTPLLTVVQEYAQHQGGHMRFGPDGALWIGVGDGGHWGDPDLRGQRWDDLLGSILRITVNGPNPYSIPAGNVRPESMWPEVWATGLRNPWRFDFNETHVWIADVGQHCHEEINAVALTEVGPNFGWNDFEGHHEFVRRLRTECDRMDYAHAENHTDVVFPVMTYPHGPGCSITGGFVASGDHFPAGTYLFADLCTGRLDALVAGDWTVQPVMATDLMPTSIDRHGQAIYISSADGRVVEMVPGPRSR